MPAAIYTNVHAATRCRAGSTKAVECRADHNNSSMRLSTDDLRVQLAPYDYPRRGPGRVLVIDDDDGVRTVMRKQLQHAGFDVVTAASGSEGLAMMRQDTSIRLVLLDMIMPALDGWGVRQKQMEDPQLAEVPVIILTGAPLPSLVHAQLHAADYLLKPVGRDHLISVVSNYCQPAVHAA
jgi:CheY-like chemotaxis protein